MTEMTPAKYALNNIESFRRAMDEMPDEVDEYLKEVHEPGNCEQCHEMLARIDEQRGYSLCSDCRMQKAIEEAD